MRRTTRSKYFRGEEPTLTQFEILCKSRGLSAGDLFNTFMAQFLKQNDQGQTTLQGFPQEPERLPIFERAAVVAARSELLRTLENIERAPHENKHLFQEDLAKSLRMIEPVYIRTKDAELHKLLQQADKALK